MIGKNKPNWYHLEQAIKSILNSQKDMVVPLIVKLLSKQRPERLYYDFEDVTLSRAIKKALLLEAIKQNQWSLVASLIREWLAPWLFNIIREIDAVYYPIIMPPHLVRSYNNSTLYMIYEMAWCLEGKESPALHSYLEILMEMKGPFGPFCIIDSKAIFPINALPDEVLSNVLYQSIGSLAFSELVLKRVCKRWSLFLSPESVVVNSLFVAQQFFVPSVEPWNSFEAIRDRKPNIFVSILATWPVENFSNVEKALKACFRLHGTDPISLARIIRNIDSKWKNLKEKTWKCLDFFHFYNEEEVKRFTHELVITRMEGFPSNSRPRYRRV